MDYELIFWIVVGVFCFGFMLLAVITPHDEPVSQDTIRRICNERTHQGFF